MMSRWHMGTVRISWTSHKHRFESTAQVWTLRNIILTRQPKADLEHGDHYQRRHVSVAVTAFQLHTSKGLALNSTRLSEVYQKGIMKKTEHYCWIQKGLKKLSNHKHYVTTSSRQSEQLLINFGNNKIDYDGTNQTWKLWEENPQIGPTS